MTANGGKQDKGYRMFVSGAKGVIRVLIIVFFIIVVIFLGRKAYSIGYDVGSSSPVAENLEKGMDVKVRITGDMTVRDVGDLLHERGIIKESGEAFEIMERLSDYHEMMIPGAYVLNTSMTIDEMLRIMSQMDEEDDKLEVKIGRPATSKEAEGK